MFNDPAGLRTYIVARECVPTTTVVLINVKACGMTMIAKTWHPVPAVDSPEDIAEMMAEAARVDVMFRSGAISTLFVPAIATARFEFEAYAPRASRSAELAV